MAKGITVANRGYGTEDEINYLKTIGQYKADGRYKHLSDSGKLKRKTQMLKKYIEIVDKRVIWAAIEKSTVVSFAKAELGRLVAA